MASTSTSRTTRRPGLVASAAVLAGICAAVPAGAASGPAPGPAAHASNARVAWTKLVTGGVRLTGARAVADPRGNVYVAGEGADALLAFDGHKPNGFRTQPHADATDLWFAKLGSDGRLLWLSYLGASGDDRLGQLVPLRDGRLAFSATASGDDFDGTNGGFHGGDSDAVVGVLSANGSSVRARYVGSAASETSFSLAAAGDGGFLVGGHSAAADGVQLTATPGAVRAPAGAAVVRFAARLSPSLDVRWLATLGAAGGANAFDRGTALGADGKAYLASDGQDKGMPTTAGAVQRARGTAEFSGHVAALSADGRRILWATYAAPGGDVAWVAFGRDGSAYLTGATKDAAFPRVRPTQRSCGRNYDFFAQRLRAGGRSYAWSTCVGGTQGDYTQYGKGYGAALDSAGTLWLTGATASRDFPSVRPSQAFAGSLRPDAPGFSHVDGAVIGFDPSGRLRLGTPLGGRELMTEEGQTVSGAPGGALVAGVSEAPDFPGTSGSPTNGAYCFVTRLAL
jgi:hypothetical protein